MFNYQIEIKSIFDKGNELKFFKIVSKSDKDAIKKAKELYFKNFLIAVWRECGSQKVCIKRF